MGTIYAGAAAPFCFSEERFLTPFPSSLSPFSLSLFSLPNLGFLPSFYNERKSRYGKRRKKGSWRTNSHRGWSRALIINLWIIPSLFMWVSWTFFVFIFGFRFKGYNVITSLFFFLFFGFMILICVSSQQCHWYNLSKPRFWFCLSPFLCAGFVIYRRSVFVSHSGSLDFEGFELYGESFTSYLEFQGFDLPLGSSFGYLIAVSIFLYFRLSVGFLLPVSSVFFFQFLFHPWVFYTCAIKATFSCIGLMKIWFLSGVKKKLKYFPSLIVDLPPCPPLCKEQTEACKEIFFMKKDEAGLLRLSQYLNRIFLSFSFRLRFFRGSCLHFSCNLGLFYSRWTLDSTLI